MVSEKSTEMRKLNVALINRELHMSGLSPMNHEVDYHRGWFYIDDDPAQQRPELTEEARDLYSKGERAVYSSQGNTFFLRSD